MLAPRRRVILGTSAIGDHGEPGPGRTQEPAEPDALALAALAHPVHAVIPVAGAHQRQAMRPRLQARIERKCAVVEQTYLGLRYGGLKERVMLIGLQDRSLEEWYQLVEDAA